MKSIPLQLAALLAIASSACKESQPAAQPESITPPVPIVAPPDAVPTETPAGPSEIPILPVKKGDFWRYQVRLEVTPQPNAPATTPPAFQITRTFLGKTTPIPGKPELDTFEVVTPGSDTEHEYVEIYDDRVLMRGSAKLKDGKIVAPMLFDTPIPFVTANLRAGASLPTLTIAKGEMSRSLDVVGRESCTVPAGTYRTVRLLMRGSDAKTAGIEMRRTIWFAPGVGIVKEITTRYSRDTKLVDQTKELIETNVKQP